MGSTPYITCIAICRTEVTNADSVTKYQEYIARAKECGMKASDSPEHGSLFEWYHKKSDIEAAGMKYLHGIECYLTQTFLTKRFVTICTVS